MTPRGFRRLLVLAGAAAMVVAAPAGAAARPARTVLATCDTAPGVTVGITATWRLFRPRPVDVFSGSGDVWACRRGAGVARAFIDLGSAGILNLHRIAGDLAEFDNGGRYTSETVIVDLARVRYLVVADDSGLNERALLGSGAIVDATYPAAFVGGDDDAGAGVYTTGADGSVAYATPPPVTDRSTWSTWGRGTGVHRVHRTFRVRPKPGLTITPVLGSDLQLEARAATKRTPASLTLTCPEITAYGTSSPHQTDVVARLVPGSEAEVQPLARGVIAARYLDAPGDVRLRAWETGRRDAHRRLDLPLTAPGPYATAGVASTSVAVGYESAVAVAGTTGITLLQRDSATGKDSVRTLPIPGAADLAMASTADGHDYQFVLYYKDAAGTPQRFAFSQPEA